MYCLNQITKENINNEILSIFMCGYFNDIIGSITFMAYINIVLDLKQLNIHKLHHIIMVMLGCGFFWEVITPIFRKSTVADFWDAVAYLCGGILYWLILKIYKFIKKTKEYHYE